MHDPVEKIKRLLPRELIYCDVGARWGIVKPWSSFRDIVRLISFEPDREEYDSLMKNKDSNDTIYPYALFDEPKRLPLNLTRSRGCSSIYKPNLEFLKNYPDYERFEIEDAVTIETTSLDSLYNEKVLPRADFIKLDVQGAELGVLEGGEVFLNENILGIEVEVEFQPMYEKQPLFSDVDRFIRESLGLQIQDIRKTYWKYPEGIDVGGAKGQLIFGDALYFRPPQDVLPWCSRFCIDDVSDKLQMACLVGIIYGYLDYSLCLLSQPSLSDFMDEDTINGWRSLIYYHGKSLKYRRKGAGKLSNIINLLYRICQPVHEGWGSEGHHLGTRKQYGIFG